MLDGSPARHDEEYGILFFTFPIEPDRITFTLCGRLIYPQWVGRIRKNHSPLFVLLSFRLFCSLRSRV